MCMEELETFLASPQQAMEEHYAARELAAAIERFLDTQSKENRALIYASNMLCREVISCSSLRHDGTPTALPRLASSSASPRATPDCA